MSYNFFCNTDCEYFPCHSTKNTKDFNCLFCYCPLSPYKECGGNYKILENGWKDCENCLIPHFNYEYIIDKLKELHDTGTLLK